MEWRLQMDLFEELRQFDVNVEEALHRLRGNRELYRELLLGIPEDVAEIDVGGYLQQGDYAQAAMNAHALKGEMANLGVTPLYNWYTSINALLREEKISEAKKLYEEGEDRLHAFLSVLKKYQ